MAKYVEEASEIFQLHKDENLGLEIFSTKGASVSEGENSRVDCIMG